MKLLISIGGCVIFDAYVADMLIGFFHELEHIPEEDVHYESFYVVVSFVLLLH